MFLIDIALGLLCATGILTFMVHVGYLANRFMIKHNPSQQSSDELLWEPDGVEEWLETADGAKIRILHKGSGRPVILLHDAGVSSTMMNLMWKGLARYGFRVITFDYRGHGASSEGKAGINLEMLSKDLQEVIDFFSLERGILVGHAGGSSVAFRYLINYPEQSSIQGMVSIGGFAGGRLRGFYTHTIQQKLFQKAWFRQLLRHSFYGFGFAATGFGNTATNQQVRSYMELMFQRPLTRLKGLFHEFSQLDDYPRLTDIQIPIIATASRKDQRIHPLHTAKIVQSTPNSSLRWIPDGGNMLVWEQPFPMIELVREMDKSLRGIAIEKQPY